MKSTLRFYLEILCFSLIISLPLLIPYFHSGYFPTHDGEWAVVRLSDMFREVRDFQFPPRYSGNLNFGYGYPLFNFTYPFPYYLGLLIHLVGFGFINSIKIVFGLSVVISAFFMFLASENIWKNKLAGAVSATLYLYFPYRVLDLFVRGSIGESVAFALFPITLFCLSKLIENPKIGLYAVLGAISYAVLILSHNIMAVLFSLTLLIYFLGNFISKGREIIKPFLFVTIFGFILSAYFLIPALLEKHNILLSAIPIEDRSLYFVSFKQLLFSPWGYGIPTDKTGGFTYQLGWQMFMVLATILSLLIYQLYKKIKRSAERTLAISLLLGFLFLSIFLFSFSNPLWKLPILSEIDFPWTMLSQLGLIISLLAGYLTKFKYTKYLVILTAVLGLILYIPKAIPQSYSNKGDGYYFTNDATTTSSNELMPLWVRSFPLQRPDEKVEVLSGNETINNLFFNSKKISFSLLTPGKSIIRINTIYYPGWEIFDNNRQISISYDNPYGVMEISLSKGSHSILAKFTETPLRLISDMISVAGLLLMLGIFARAMFRMKPVRHK